MRKLQFVIPSFVLVVGLVAGRTPAYGKKEYTAKEKTACKTCHVDAVKTPKELTDAGKCYGKQPAAEKNIKSCQAK
jgi:hypothetical protein